MDHGTTIAFDKVVPGRVLVVRFHPQAWINDYAVDIDGATHFDATQAYLRYTPDERKALFDSPRDADDLRPTWLMPEHHGPFWIDDVAEAIEAFHGDDAAYATYIAGLPDGYLAAKGLSAEPSMRFTLVLNVVPSGTMIEETLRTLADSDDIASYCGRTVCGIGDGDVVAEVDGRHLTVGSWKVEEVNGQRRAPAGDKATARGDSSTATAADSGIERVYPRVTPCSYCIENDERPIGTAVHLMHGLPACEACIAWHKSDPHNEGDDCGTGFANCLAPLSAIDGGTAPC